MRNASYKKKIKKKIYLQNILILICVVLLGYLVYAKFRPEIVKVPVKDDCGPIGNTISHLISDNEDCVNACSSACKSFGHVYYKSKFIYNNEVRCNNCTCQCKKI
ncbi:hypothetical protein GF327_03690 [Candidatus Woesearchaeota archaeon]|nr:hypothetical protein [Candidatus Woesearchaeota archaeon]